MSRLTKLIEKAKQITEDNISSSELSRLKQFMLDKDYKVSSAGSGGSWLTGTLYAQYKINALVFSEPTYYGINGGRVSKLWIKDEDSGKEVCNYDRGWDVKPTGKVKDMVKSFLSAIPGEVEKDDKDPENNL